MQEATPRTGRETRDKILRAAVSLISEVGWGGVTVRLVAERAGVNNALPNYYFGSKEALLVEAAVAAVHEEYGAALRAIEKADSLSEALRQAFDSLRRPDEMSPNLGVLLEMTLQASRDARLREILLETARPHLDAVAAMVRKGVDRGEVSPDADVEALAVVLSVMMDGLVLYGLIDRDLDPDRIADAVAALVRGPNVPDPSHT